MRNARRRRGLGPVLLLNFCCALAADAVVAQQYPSRPVRMIAGVAPGGGLDTICRSAAQMLTDKLGQAFVVDNRPGGGTVLAMDVVAQAAPDGHTLLCAPDTTFIVGASKRVAYDVRKA